MNIWAISDLHLSFGIDNKSMDIFGEHWHKHYLKIEEEWIKKISNDDIVLIPGDISWAKKLIDAKEDFEWIDGLPGKKIITKGNHDYWWQSLSKVNNFLPPSIIAIQATSYTYENITISGTKFHESNEFNFSNLYEHKHISEFNEKLFNRELLRLENSLKSIADTDIKIIMTHYPVIGDELTPTKASILFDNYNITHSIFGHLHGLQNHKNLFGQLNNTKYILTSCDYLNFNPIKII